MPLHWATFRFAAPPRIEVLQLTACIGLGTSQWLRRRATIGIAAVSLGLADGRSTNSNTPSEKPVTAVQAFSGDGECA
jgi:hypothetical protein